MSSNQGHYIGSLPNDYAILARFAHGGEGSGWTDGEENTNEHSRSDSANEFYPHRGLKSEVTRRSSFSASYIRPPSSTISSMNFDTPVPVKHTSSTDGLRVTESTPLLGPLIPRIAEEHSGNEDNKTMTAMFWEELWILSKYSLPLFSLVLCIMSTSLQLIPLCRTHVLEYSLVIASVVSIGHLSTTALAASTLGSMTAGVSGFSIIQGFTSTLDTLLPSAWTSSQPHLVGLWSHRMGLFHDSRPLASILIFTFIQRLS